MSITLTRVRAVIKHLVFNPRKGPMLPASKIEDPDFHVKVAILNLQTLPKGTDREIRTIIVCIQHLIIALMYLGLEDAAAKTTGESRS